jgi:hypothetical protein
MHHDRHETEVQKTEQKILGHLTHHHANTEIYKELYHLRADDAKHGRHFGTDLHTINMKLQHDTARHHLPHITIEEDGKKIRIKQDNWAEHLDHKKASQAHSAHGSYHLSNSAASPSESGFGKALLEKMHLPVTAKNLAFLDAWQQAEGGSPDNPFNTTQGAPGARNFNGVGVKRYPSMEVGLDATVKTLKNGYYGKILSALQREDTHSAANALRVSAWGTHNMPHIA